MNETLINFETAKLAKEKGFDIPVRNFYPDLTWDSKELYHCVNVGFEFTNEDNGGFGDIILAPTQSLLQKFIRETRGVHIEIHRNASGYYWSMCKADGGTDLGWSDISGPNDGGVWDSFESALENALQVQLSYDLPNNMTIIKHWGNYVEFALKSK